MEIVIPKIPIKKSELDPMNENIELDELPLSPKGSKKGNNAMFAHPEAKEARKKKKGRMNESELQQMGFWSLQKYIFEDNFAIFSVVVMLMFDWFRYIMSFVFLAFSFFFVSYAIVFQLNAFYKEVPTAVAYILFILLLVILSLMEGIQIAIVETLKQPIESIKSATNCHYITSLTRQPHRLQSFLMGRQIIVLFVVFLLGRLSTFTETLDIYWIPTWFQVGLLQTGLFGAITVVILGQLVPQIIASEYPVQFLNFGGYYFPLMKITMYITLIIEWSGIMHATWGISRGIEMFLFKVGLFEADEPQNLGEEKIEKEVTDDEDDDDEEIESNSDDNSTVKFDISPTIVDIIDNTDNNIDWEKSVLDEGSIVESTHH
jgi:hypothetical protein